MPHNVQHPTESKFAPMQSPSVLLSAPPLDAFPLLSGRKVSRRGRGGGGQERGAQFMPERTHAECSPDTDGRAAELEKVGGGDSFLFQFDFQFGSLFR